MKNLLLLTVSILLVQVSYAQKSGKWVYAKWLDKRTHEQVDYYTLESTNKIATSFHRPEKLTFIFSLLKNREVMYLALTNNDFSSSVDSVNTIWVKFDNFPEQKMEFMIPNDNTKKVVYIAFPEQVLMRIRSAHKMVIRAGYVNEFNCRAEFNVSGLIFQ